jgi:trimethylamine:corrinoid methyltransferase-like protein
LTLNHYSLGPFALDLRYGTTVFGSPKACLLGHLSAEIESFYGPWRAYGIGHASAGIRVQANSPGAQDSAEEASLMAAGALMEARSSSGAVILSLDEVFSAEQLPLDLEIRDSVQRPIAGLDLDDAGIDWPAEVERGKRGAFS